MQVRMYVARLKDTEDEFAYEAGSANNNSVIMNTDLEYAQKFFTPIGLMSWLGRSYKKYDMVAVEVITDIKITGTKEWPNEKDVFRDR